MLRNKPRLEGPLAAPIVGAVVSTVLGSILSKKSNQSYPTVQAPATPAPTPLPATPVAQPTEAPTGEAAALTPAEIAAGNEQKARRGRLSTILSQQQAANAVGETGNETLG